MITAISIPRDLKDRFDEYNKNHPYSKINLSQISQKALDDALNSVQQNDAVTKNNVKDEKK